MKIIFGGNSFIQESSSNFALFSEFNKANKELYSE